MSIAKIIAVGALLTGLCAASAYANAPASFVLETIAKHRPVACRTREYRVREYHPREYRPRTRHSRCSDFLHNGYDHSPCQRHSRARGTR